MPNINKVVFGNTTLIDLTDSTLSSADQLASGVTAYDRSGTKLTGTGSAGGASIAVLEVFTVTEDADAVKYDLDSTWASLYNFILIELNITYSSSEWLYYDYNTTNPTSNYLGAGAASHWIMLPIRFNSSTNKWERVVQNRFTGPQKTSTDSFPSYLYMKTYRANAASFKGSTITVYGGNLA